MKVLHILNTNKFSGAENVVCQIMDMFKSDTDVEMVYCSPDGQIRQALADRNIPYVSVNSLSVSEIKRVIREQKPDIIHSHDVMASLIAALVCKKIKLINTIHVNDVSMRKIGLKSLIYRFTAKKAKHIFWVSNSCFENFRYKKSIAKKSSILYNVVDGKQILARAELDNNQYDYDVVYVGRLSEQKDPLRLIDVISICINKNPLIKVGIIGTGDYFESVKEKINTLGLESNVDLLGFSENPLKIMSQAKVMIMTSKFEGTPMCSLEAMALGLPIVSTPTDGLCELIDDKVTGFLSNDNEQLAEKICYICENENIYKEMKENTLKRFASINDLVKYKDSLYKVYDN